jgi:hypothetical protein
LQSAIAALEAELAQGAGPSANSVTLLGELQTIALALDGKIEDLPAVPVA